MTLHGRKLGIAAILLAACAPELDDTTEHDLDTEGEPAVEIQSAEQAIYNGVLSYTSAVASLSSPGGSTYCSGTLVNPTTILTAAHCNQGDLASVDVRFVSPSIFVTGRWMGIHPDWETGGIWFANDFGVVILDTPITTITPLAVSPTVPSNGTTTNLVGYGGSAANCNPNIVGTQRSIGLGISSRTFISPQPIAGSFLTYNNSSYYVCPADSGGPALYNNRVVGVASWGNFATNSNYVASPRLLDWMGVTVFDGTSYTGASQAYMAGSYDHPSMVSVPNDAISSMKVAPGYSVRLHAEGSFWGDTAVYSGAVANVGALLNNRASSMVVSPGVTLYREATLWGNPQTFTAGFYDWTALNVVGNDQVSSMAVAPGMQVYACAEGGLTGDCQWFTGWHSYVGNLLNDRISSIWVGAR